MSPNEKPASVWNLKVAFLKVLQTPTSALAMEKVENFLYN
jgi:hypothetical protein